MKKTVTKIVSALLALTLTVSVSSTLFACGDYELSSIVVNQTSIVTQYEEGATVSFDGIKIKAKFTDGSEEDLLLSDCKVYLGTEDVTQNLSKIAETSGIKTVTIEYQNKTATITFTIVKPYNGGGVVISYEEPSAYSAYIDATQNAGKLSYGEDGYEGQFETGDADAKDYIVGDDNNFKFVPQLSYLDNNDTPQVAATFVSVTTIKYDGEELSTKNGTEENTVVYFAGEVDYVIAFTDKNEYKFTENAIGKQFELSVMPSDIFEGVTKPVTAIVNIVDGFNVYNADQLAVIDNGENTDKRKDKDSGFYFWADKKEANGLKDIPNPTSIVLQNDIIVTADFVPDYFKYTLTEDIVYTEGGVAVDSTEISKTFLREKNPTKADATAQTNILVRYMNEGETFTIHGNYHSLNLNKLPLVCSFDNSFSDDFGLEGSNANFLLVEGYGKGVATNTTPAGTFNISNLDIVGNANINPRVDKDGTYIYAGGIIFTKISQVNSHIDNVKIRTTFIPLFPEFYSPVAISNTKIYDSFNCAIFTYDQATLTIEDCNIERAGGPLILSQINKPEVDTTGKRAPIITVDNDSVLENLVTGQEFWFVSKGANALVEKVAVLNYVFHDTDPNNLLPDMGRVVTKQVDNQQKLNVIYAVTPSTNEVTQLVGNFTTQALFSYKGVALDRIFTDPQNHLIGYMTNQALATAGGAGAVGMTFNTGTAFGYMASETTPSIDASMLQGFATSNYVAINYGGLGLFLEFFPA